MRFDDPGVQLIIAQAEALSATLTYVDRGSGHDEVLQLVGDALDRGVFLTVEELTIQSAMRLILGRDDEPANHCFYQATKPPMRKFFETIAQAWMVWAEKGPVSQALEALHQLEDPSTKREALHLMALQPWRLAVMALLKEDPVKARRQFLRATELGGQLGTETNPVVQWSYAASFFL